MKKLFIATFILLCLIVQSQYAQTNTGASIFNRLLIFNSNNELLVVKVKGSGDWLTPGFYQSDEISVRKGLIYTASLYGISISKPKLHGVFILRRGDNNLSYRNMFSATTKDEVSEMPDVVSEAKWVAVDKTAQVTSFLHIDTLIKQATLHPDTVWGGSIMSYREDKKSKVKTLEEFYPLFRGKTEKKK